MFKFKAYYGIASVVVSSFSYAMEVSVYKRPDANGYEYKDEATVQDKRKIAILAYGSLVRQQLNPRTGAQLHARDFSPTDLYLPISMTRESLGKRVTAVIDRMVGEDKRVWYALSDFNFLPNARHNLAAREGCSLRSLATGYDLTNIFYMKKLLSGRTKEDAEEVINGSSRWVISSCKNARQKIAHDTALKIVQWAERNGITAVIWASFPPTLDSQQEVANTLLRDPELLCNTQEYVRNLPDGAQTVLERAIVAGKEMLAVLANTHQSLDVNLLRQELQQAVDQEGQRDIERISLLLDLAEASHKNQAPMQAQVQHHDLITIERGTMPIILTAPHGGTFKVPGVPRREHGEHCYDGNTHELTHAISNALYELYGVRPYIVAARFSRKYIDANRAANQAYEHILAKPVYDIYHGQIADFIQEIRSGYGQKALLLDIHAHGLAYDTIYRGTQNRTTVKELIRQCGEQAFTGPKSILGILAQQGYKVFPSSGTLNTQEHSSFNGGFTVRNYGSHKSSGIDAIQLEFGWHYRDPRNIPTFAKAMAKAIMEFYTTYLASGS